MLRIIFIRHGRTSWNAQGRVQGGGSLDRLGRAQAAAVGEWARRESIAAVFASPALRARQTAQVVARCIGLPVRERALLRDLDYGRYSGVLMSDLEVQDPELVHRWRDLPHTVHFEAGESLAVLRKRITQFIRRTAERHGDGVVLAATHDSPVRMAASLALGLDDSQHNQRLLHAPLGSITVLEVDDGTLRLPLHNYVGHLEGIDGVD